MLETYQIQLEFIDWGSGSYNWEFWRMAFLNICKKFNCQGELTRFSWLCFFPFDLKKNDGCMTAPRCFLGLSPCACVICVSVLLFIIFVLLFLCFNVFSAKDILISGLFMLKVLSCGFIGDLVSELSAPVEPHSQRGTSTQEVEADNWGVSDSFFLCCYILGTWFDRWYIQILVIMSHV